MSSKRKIWLIILTLAILSVARESGYVNLQYTDSKFNNQMQVDLYFDVYEFKDEKQSLTDEDMTYKHETSANDASWHLGFHTNPQTNIFSDFGEQLQKDLRQDKNIVIKIQNVELSGLYWSPLYKSGYCKYNFYVEAAEERTKVFHGTAKGLMYFSIVGISSVTKAKEEISQKIANTVIKNIKSDVK